MNGQVEREIYKFNERVEIRLSRELSKGRSRVNCTAKDKNGDWFKDNNDTNYIEYEEITKYNPKKDKNKFIPCYEK